ncbi:MAG: TadE/TadG family type IV pilus assembly protein [Acidaminococcaceae bacterium]
MFKNKTILKNNRGQTLVELALVLPVLVALIFGMTDFGRVINGYLAATEASREGARIAALREDNSTVEAAVRNASPSLNQSNLTVITIPETRVRGESVTVTVIYNVDIITPLINTMLTNPYPINCQTIMRVE